MATLEVFSGTWTVQVIGHVTNEWFERFWILGSDQGDSVHPGTVGSPAITVSGARWSIKVQWNDGATPWNDTTTPGAWVRDSDLVRTPTYTLADGLVVLVGADSNGDGNHNDLVIRCQNQDPHLTPWRPVTAPYDFTRPRVRPG